MLNALRTMVRFLGLDDKEGNISFNKTVTATTLLLFWVMVIERYDPAWPTLMFGIVVIGAGFGLKGYVAALERVEMRGTGSTDKRTDVSLTGDVGDIVRAIKERRAGSDTEPTP